MVKRTTTLLIDDIDGSEAAETVTFGLDGTTFEIDLNEHHAEDLREVLAPFVSVARRASGAGRRGRASGSSKPQSKAEVDPKAVRAWAQANGVTVNARGRLKADVVEQYQCRSVRRRAGRCRIGTGSDSVVQSAVVGLTGRA